MNKVETTAAKPRRVRTLHYYFTWEALGNRRYHFTRLPRTKQGHTHPWENGADVEVSIEVFEAVGRLYIGAVRVTTTPEDIDFHVHLAEAPAVDVRPVTTDLLRLLPLGELEAEAIAEVRSWDGYRAALDELADQPEVLDRLESAVNNPQRPERRARKLTPELLRVVAQAPRVGGSTPVQGVMAALDAAGYEGNGPSGETTWDQAAKAVQRARRDGYLPPARRRMNEQERGVADTSTA